MTLADVPRNDLDAAERYYRLRQRLHPEEYRTLYLLQDNPRKFVEMSVNWDVVKPPPRFF